MKPTQIDKAKHSKLELEKFRKSTKNTRLFARITAIIDLYDDMPHTVVAKSLQIDTRTLYRWICRYNEGGMQALIDIPHERRSRSITLEEEEQLKQDLAKSPVELGYNFQTWTGKNVCMHLHVKYSKKISLSTIYVIIHRLGFN